MSLRGLRPKSEAALLDLSCFISSSTTLKEMRTSPNGKIKLEGARLGTICQTRHLPLPLFRAPLSNLTACSMHQRRRITPGRYKGTRRQSKAVGSTGGDSGQLLEVIKAFEPGSRFRPSLCVSPASLPLCVWPQRGQL